MVLWARGGTRCRGWGKVEGKGKGRQEGGPEAGQGQRCWEPEERILSHMQVGEMVGRGKEGVRAMGIGVGRKDGVRMSMQVRGWVWGWGVGRSDGYWCWEAYECILNRMQVRGVTDEGGGPRRRDGGEGNVGRG